MADRLQLQILKCDVSEWSLKLYLRCSCLFASIIQLSNGITCTLPWIALYIAEINGIWIEFTQILVLLPTWRCEFIQLSTVAYFYAAISKLAGVPHVSFRMKLVNIMWVVFYFIFSFLPYSYIIGFQFK